MSACGAVSNPVANGASGNLGDTIHYTLDAAANRTNEPTKDLSGMLKRSLARQYNQLNRLTRTLNAANTAVQTFQNPADAPPSGITYTDGYDGNGKCIFTASVSRFIPRPYHKMPWLEGVCCCRSLC